jgi:hypothetical protein
VTEGTESITDRASPCPLHNAGLVSALKIYRYACISFGLALDEFIDHLEGSHRIMEVVPADFLKHSVELALRKFFKVVRSVKTSALVDMKVSSPDQCYLSWLFERFAKDMAFHPKMVKMEAYYRCQMARSKALAYFQRPKEAAAKVNPGGEERFVKALRRTSRQPVGSGQI